MSRLPHLTFRPGPVALALAALLAIAPPPAASSAKAQKIRIGISESIFAGLNENDSRAAMQSWADAVAASGQLDLNGPGELLRSDTIVHAIANHLIDAFTITTPEYAKVARFVDPLVFMDEGSAKSQLEYVLLVRQDSGIHDIAGLRGRSLIVYEHVTMCLAPAWLELLLASSSAESSAHLFGRISSSNKVSQTVLPVFFGRADACLVSRRAFDTMSELNPQLRQKLQILVASPKVLASVVGVHKDCPDEMKLKIRNALLGMYDGASGRQVLTLFQAKRIIVVDPSIFRSSLDLLSAYDRLKAQRAAKR